MDERTGLGQRFVRAVQAVGLDPAASIDLARALVADEPRIEQLCEALEIGHRAQLDRLPRSDNGPATPIDFKKLPASAYSKCFKWNLATHGDLQMLTRHELQGLANIGSKTVDALESYLTAAQLRFRGADEDFMDHAQQVYGDPLKVPVSAVLIYVLRPGRYFYGISWARTKGWKTLQDLSVLPLEALDDRDFLSQPHFEQLVAWLHEMGIRAEP